MEKQKTIFGKKVEQVGKKTSWGSVKLTRMYNKRGKMSEGKYTTSRFTKTFTEGTYIVTTKGHAFTIKDGIIYGNTDDSFNVRRIILSAFKIG